MNSPAVVTVPAPRRVLVCDDQVDVTEALRLLLKGAGYKPDAVNTPDDLLRAVAAHDYDLILLDLNYTRDTTSGQEGLDLLSRLQEARNAAPVMVMTAWGEIALAVEAMRRGAMDFIQKPWDNARLLQGVEKQVAEGVRRRAALRPQRSELEVARHVQEHLFPHTAVALTTLACAGRCVPAREVGGDYYDFLELGPGRLGVVLADVSGKGVPAALLMAHLQASFRSHVALGREQPGALLCAVNELFHGSSAPEHYATLFFAVYEEKTRCLRYWNCGHPPALLCRAQGAVEHLAANSTVVGLFRAWGCEEGSTRLEPGDRLLVCSDGVLEAGMDGDAEMSVERLEELLVASRGDSAEATLELVSAAARQAAHDHIDDDLTVVVLEAR